MPNVYIGEERAVCNKGLAECLSSGIHKVNTEDEMGCSELPVPMHKNLEPK